MDERKYKGILYVIVATMLLTVVVQCYWNYKNYLQNKQRYINDVQIALDNALDNYYADLAKSHPITFVDSILDSIDFPGPSSQFDPNFLLREWKKTDVPNSEKGILRLTHRLDSTKDLPISNQFQTGPTLKIIRGTQVSDSLNMLRGITSIFISIQNDTLDFKALNPLIAEELHRKDLDIEYGLKHYKNDSLYSSFNENNIQPHFLYTASKTKFLKQDERLELAYPDATGIILKAGSFEILLSLVLILAIVSCLFRLLKIIKDQKQLAEIKNDLISNVTHEFKTPITTVSVALESIKDFNAINDKEKTKSYINISQTQLEKLKVMVEKLLETAALDSESLQLNKEPANISEMLKTVVDKHRMQAHGKQIVLDNTTSLEASVDVFHFENALNNVLDNAIKYGGNNIRVSAQKTPIGLEILLSDDGKMLTKGHKDIIFEKFYRLHKGNTHDIKGFGIGLYYTKKIIEKHKGRIDLDLDGELTTFKISIPDATA